MRLNTFLFARPPLTVLSLLAALSIGCGAVRNPALENARDAYQKARQDPMIVRHAAVALDRAGQSLQEADRLWRGKRKTSPKWSISLTSLRNGSRSRA